MDRHESPNPKKLLAQHGFYIKRQGKGDHEIWTNGTISFPIDGKSGHEIPIGTLRNMLKIAGIDLNEPKEKGQP